MSWKVTEVSCNGDLITAAKYYASMDKEGYFADSEGYWHFIEPQLRTPFAEVTEEMVINWIKTESDGAIEKRLSDQIETLKAQRKVAAPWEPQTFTLET